MDVLLYIYLINPSLKVLYRRFDDKFHIVAPNPHRGNISSGFVGISEAFTSEILDNLEDMFLWHYMKSNKFSLFIFSITK